MNKAQLIKDIADTLGVGEDDIKIKRFDANAGSCIVEIDGLDDLEEDDGEEESDDLADDEDEA